MLIKNLDKLFIITQYDIKNIQNSDVFLKAICDSFESFNLEQLVLRKKQLENLLLRVPQKSHLNHKFYNAMMDIFDIQIDLYKAETVSANRKLKVLNNTYLNATEVSSDDWKIFYNVFLLNQESGNFDVATQFAELFLNAINEKSDLEYPTIIFRKIKATLVLRDCKAVVPLAQNLKARGYLENSNLKLSACHSF